MNLCVVSFKPCWQDSDGRWLSSGGFPHQMAAVGSLFDSVTLVVVRSDVQGEGGQPLPAGAKVIGLRSPSGSDGSRKLSVLVRIGYYLRTIVSHVRRADVVHVPVPGDISFLGFAIGLLFRKRLIVRYGSSWDPTPHTTYMQRLTKACMRLFAGGRNVMLATGVGEVPPAPGMLWLFSTSLSQSEVAGIDPVFDKCPGQHPCLVYAGRLSPEKGVRYLLRALARLREQELAPFPQVRILGDGPERSALEQVVRDLRIGDVVTFVGWLDRRHLFAHLRHADLCVQPSLTESFGKAWLDAMAHGVPVLSSNVGAATSAIGADGERGWLVPPGNVTALADSIRRALHETEDWPALRRRCRAFVDSYTLETWAKEIGTQCAAQWGGTLRGGKLSV